MEHPGNLLLRRAAAACAEYRLLPGQDFGLYEQIAEHAVRQVGILRRQHHLGITCDFHMPQVSGQIGQRHAADLDIVLG